MTKIQKDALMILLESMDSKMQLTLEAVTVLDHKIDSVKDELKEDIAVLDCKIMGLSKRVDSVEKNLSDRIDAVHKELIAHRNDTEVHRSLKWCRFLRQVYKQWIDLNKERYHATTPYTPQC